MKTYELNIDVTNMPGIRHKYVIVVSILKRTSKSKNLSTVMQNKEYHENVFYFVFSL